MESAYVQAEKKYKQSALLLTAALITIGVGIALLSIIFWGQNVWGNLFFDIGITLSLCMLGLLIWMCIEITDTINIRYQLMPTFIIYIFYMIFFRKSMVLIDIGLFVVFELLVYRICYAYENKVYQNRIDALKANMDNSIEKHKQLKDKAREFLEKTNDLRRCVAVDLLNEMETEKEKRQIQKKYSDLELGEIDSIDKYIPNRPLIKHCTKKKYEDYSKAIDPVMKKIERQNRKLQIKIDSMQMEIRNRLLQNQYIHSLDDEIKESQKEQFNRLTQVLKNYKQKRAKTSIKQHDNEQKKLKKILSKKVK